MNKWKRLAFAAMGFSLGMLAGSYIFDRFNNGPEYICIYGDDKEAPVCKD